jgi:hypothetical protein
VFYGKGLEEMYEPERLFDVRNYGMLGSGTE